MGKELGQCTLDLTRPNRLGSVPRRVAYVKPDPCQEAPSRCGGGRMRGESLMPAMQGREDLVGEGPVYQSNLLSKNWGRKRAALTACWCAETEIL